MLRTMVDLKQQLNDKGFRITEQRRAILDVFSKYKGEHFTSEEIYHLVSQSNPGIGVATVYRTLPLLEKMELLNRIVLEDGCVRYELSNKEEQHLHHHLICTVCGSITEVQEDMMEHLETQVYKKNGFVVKNHSVKFYGYCEKCSAN